MVQGLGNVGNALVELLIAEGADVMVADIDPGRVRLVVDETGAHPVALDAVYEAPCDIFSPCGLGGVLNPGHIDQLRCAAVAGAANNQLADPAAADRLDARGILYAPDYVINAGGLLHVALTHQNVPAQRIAERVSAIGERLGMIFEQSTAEGRPPSVIADRQAEAILYD